MEKKIYELWERIQHLEELRDSLDYLARDLYRLTEEFDFKPEEYGSLLSKDTRTLLKRKISTRLKELKRNLTLLKEKIVSNGGFEYPSIKCPELLMFVDSQRCLSCEHHVKIGGEHYCRHPMFTKPKKLWKDLW